MKHLVQSIAILDGFGQAVQFRTSRNSGTFKSVIGAIFTVAILALTAPYMVNRYFVLSEHQEQSVSTEELPDKYSDELLELIVGDKPNESGFDFRFFLLFYDLETQEYIKNVERFASLQMNKKKDIYDALANRLDNFTNNLTLSQCDLDYFNGFGDTEYLNS